MGSYVLSRSGNIYSNSLDLFLGTTTNFLGERSNFFLAATVGKPLQIDLATQNKTRPSCAKVKVEVDLFREFPKKNNIRMRKKMGEIVENGST